MAKKYSSKPVGSTTRNVEGTWTVKRAGEGKANMTPSMYLILMYSWLK